MFLMEGGQLRQRMLSLFMKHPQGFLNQRDLNKLLVEEGRDLESVFLTRYDPVFLANITKQTVFFKVMEDLASMIKSKKQLKYYSKNRSSLVLEDPDFLLYFIQLLFTQDQKKIIFKRLSQKFKVPKAQRYFLAHNQQEQSLIEQVHGTETLTYILKSLFRIGSSKPSFDDEEQ